MSLLSWYHAVRQRFGRPNLSDERHLAAAEMVSDGNQLEGAGQLQEAEQCYVTAIQCAPGMAKAHLSLGNILFARGALLASLDAYARAATLQPEYAAAHYNLGNANARLHHPHAALACYRQAVKLQPNFADAEVALGNTLEDLQQFEEAVRSYRRALLIKPDYAQVYYNLSNVLRKLGRLDEAVQSCHKALELAPDLAEAHNNLGVVLMAQQDLLGARAAFDRASAAKENFGAALIQSYHCANRLCDWGARAVVEDALIEMINHGVPGIAPFSLLSMEPRHADAPMLQRQASHNYAKVQLAGMAPRGQFGVPVRVLNQRLRVGYLSADFHDHATMHLLIGVLGAHDRAKYAIHGYSYGPTVDAVTHAAGAHCDVFRDISSLSDREAAKIIASDGIDILVDLKGFTQHFRANISAMRPAPVVMSWLGYPGTLGEPGLADYIVGDPVVTPPEHAAHFSETLALMPHCYQPNDRNRAVGVKPNRIHLGLPPAGFVFASFNQSYKLNPESFDVWCRLLSEVPGSVLWLLAPSDAAIANLQHEAIASGIDPQRLVFAPTLSPIEHLGRLQLADLVLDTFPYTSHTTGSDALWAGVPMVTRMGNTFAGRVAASLLNAVELPELITHDWEGYFALAKSLALAPQTLATLRQRLAVARLSAPLFDTERFTHNLERLYSAVWEQHQSGVKEIIQLTDSLQQIV